MAPKNYLDVEDLEVYKGYITEKTYREFRNRYKECIRMLNGLEKTLERKVPVKDRRWQVSEEFALYKSDIELYFSGWPKPQESDSPSLKPDT
jgi:hypothetical protein